MGEVVVGVSCRKSFLRCEILKYWGLILKYWGLMVGGNSAGFAAIVCPPSPEAYPARHGVGGTDMAGSGWRPGSHFAYFS